MALTVNLPYKTWSDIQGLAIDGSAAFVTDLQELAAVADLMRRKLPAYDTIIYRPDVLPWPGMLFMRISVGDLALFDYTCGYGHTSQFRYDEAQAEAGPD